MPTTDPFDLVGRTVKRVTPDGTRERGTIKAVLADGRVRIELEDGRTIVVDPEADKEWELVDAP